MPRYSQLYIERRTRASDSERARNRLWALYLRLSEQDKYISGDFSHGVVDFSHRIVEELGFDIPGRWLVQHNERIRAFFEQAEIRDVLDAITIIFEVFDKETATKVWVPSVTTIFDEERLAYRVDESGVVHPFVDLEFEVSRASALEGLDDPRFGEARTDFEAAYRHLRDGNGKDAIRRMFSAVEVAAKVLFPGKFAGLAANEVNKHIRPVLDRRYTGNQPAIDAGRLLLGGMKDWINAAQPYRHGQEQQEPAEPPMDFVIAHLSAGATYLRWMIELADG